ncbi:MAG: hypothetical protein IFK94_04225 [Acidobacteria bacterium]|uniref:Uncharacterized protein n=1 Tax=Candidatus Polarisedimenticola svalbardensis TaxID=2886004 RepID=A0A8J6XZJ8_9BACT|nr:hypothetical protein [Candidatus Polarisedimenticola svalbardensis]
MGKRPHWSIDYRKGLIGAISAVPFLIGFWYFFRPFPRWPTTIGLPLGILVGCLRTSGMKVDPARFLECSDELGLRQAYFASPAGTWAMYLSYIAWLAGPGLIVFQQSDFGAAFGLLVFQECSELFALPGKKLLSETVPSQEMGT